MTEYIRIPCDLPNEDDRRKIIAILADAGLEVRAVKVKEGTRWKRYVEFRETEATQ